VSTTDYKISFGIKYSILKCVATLPREMCLKSNNWKQYDFCNNIF